MKGPVGTAWGEGLNGDGSEGVGASDTAVGGEGEEERQQGQRRGESQGPGSTNIAPGHPING